uniref:Uncharacterized protein n=1 Tax=Ditylenchus dipsaci TaxID=166011 RepID=A0A915E3A9_9BILA
MSKNDQANGNSLEERQSCNQTMKQAQGGCQSKVWISSGIAASFIPGEIPAAKIRKIDQTGVELLSDTTFARADSEVQDIPVSVSPKKAQGGIEEVDAKRYHATVITEEETGLRAQNVGNGSVGENNEIEILFAKKSRLPRYIRYVTLSKDRELELCEELSCPHVCNMDLRRGQEDKFKCNIGSFSVKSKSQETETASLEQLAFVLLAARTTTLL